MTKDQLSKRVHLTGLAAVSVTIKGSDGTIIAAGPITKQPGTVAGRQVIAVTGKELIVATQYFPEFPGVTEYNFENGNYLGLDQLDVAQSVFAKRLADNADSVRSIYRGS
jgi:hypothetical protein